MLRIQSFITMVTPSANGSRHITTRGSWWTFTFNSWGTSTFLSAALSPGSQTLPLHNTYEEKCDNCCILTAQYFSKTSLHQFVQSDFTVVGGFRIYQLKIFVFRSSEEGLTFGKLACSPLIFVFIDMHHFRGVGAGTPIIKLHGYVLLWKLWFSGS